MAVNRFTSFQSLIQKNNDEIARSEKFDVKKVAAYRTISKVLTVVRAILSVALFVIPLISPGFSPWISIGSYLGAAIVLGGISYVFNKKAVSIEESQRARKLAAKLVDLKTTRATPHHVGDLPALDKRLFWHNSEDKKVKRAHPGSLADAKRRCDALGIDFTPAAQLVAANDAARIETGEDSWAQYRSDVMEAKRALLSREDEVEFYMAIDAIRKVALGAVKDFEYSDAYRDRLRDEAMRLCEKRGVNWCESIQNFKILQIAYYKHIVNFLADEKSNLNLMQQVIENVKTRHPVEQFTILQQWDHFHRQGQLYQQLCSKIVSLEEKIIELNPGIPPTSYRPVFEILYDDALSLYEQSISLPIEQAKKKIADLKNKIEGHWTNQLEAVRNQLMVIKIMAVHQHLERLEPEVCKLDRSRSTKNQKCVLVAATVIGVALLVFGFLTMNKVSIFGGAGDLGMKIMLGMGGGLVGLVALRCLASCCTKKAEIRPKLTLQELHSIVHKLKENGFQYEWPENLSDEACYAIIKLAPGEYHDLELLERILKRVDPKAPLYAQEINFQTNLAKLDKLKGDKTEALKVIPRLMSEFTVLQNIVEHEKRGGFAFALHLYSGKMKRDQFEPIIVEKGDVKKSHAATLKRYERHIDRSLQKIDNSMFRTQMLRHLSITAIALGIMLAYALVHNQWVQLGAIGGGVILELGISLVDLRLKRLGDRITEFRFKSLLYRAGFNHPTVEIEATRLKGLVDRYSLDGESDTAANLILGKGVDVRKRRTR